MPRVAQLFVQIIPLLETTGALTHFDYLRLDLGHKACSTRPIVERNKVANVDKVCPRSGQDNQLCHGSGLVGVARAQLSEHLVGRNTWATIQPRLDRIP